MNDDPIVNSVRKVRDQLAARFNYDVHAIFDDMRLREPQFGDRVVRQPQSRRKVVNSIPDTAMPDNGSSRATVE